MEYRELLLLGLLRRQSMHGYQLIDFIENNLGQCTDLKKPTAYFLLDKMAAAGWIRFETSREGRRPVKRIYSLTPEGEIVFQRLLRDGLASSEPTFFWEDVSLAFLEVLDPREAASLLEMHRDLIGSRLEKVRTAPDHPGTIQWMVEHQVRFLEMELAWTDELIRRLGDTGGA